LGKFAKKLSKIKEQKACEKCKGEEELKEKAEREREIFLKEREVLKNEIKELKKVVSSFSEHADVQASNNLDALHK
jgi:hypothetical protein